MTTLHTFPNEILQEVFIQCLPTEHNATMEASEAPVILIRVCSHWRMIAMSTPKLWASLHVAVPRSKNEDEEQIFARYDAQISYIPTWLSRAKTAPLSISILGWNADDEDNALVPQEEQIQRVMKAILPFSKTWRCLSLHVGKDGLFTLSSLTAADVPILQTFKAINSHGDNPHFDVLLSCPTLRELDIGMPLNHMKHHSLMQQLTSLTLRDIWPFARILQILQQCINLEVLRCHFVAAGTDQLFHVVLPKLLVLQVVDEGSVLPQILHHLEAPQLRSFLYHIYYPPESGILLKPLSPNFFNRFGGAIQTFCIESSCLEYPEVRSFLEGNSIIKHLGISFSRLNYEGARITLLLPQDEPSQTFCPLLESLELRNFYRVSNDKLVELLSSRAKYTPTGHQSPRFQKVIFRLGYTELSVGIRPSLPPALKSDLHIVQIPSANTVGPRWQLYEEFVDY